MMERGDDLSAMPGGSAASHDGTAAWPRGSAHRSACGWRGTAVYRPCDTVIEMLPGYERGLFCSSP